MDQDKDLVTEETIMKTKRTFNKDGSVMISIFAICSAVLAIVALPVSAATFTVATFDDELTTNGVCSLREAIVNANDNAQTYADCPAGEAGVDIDGNALDIINLPAGTYTLILAGVDELCENPVYYTGSGTPTTCTGDGSEGNPYKPTITSDASKGDLDITDDLAINGDPDVLTQIQWAAAAPDEDPLTGDRIFHVAVRAGATANIASVVIQDLTLANGDVGIIPTSPDPGGGDLVLPGDANAYDIEVVNTTAGSIEIWQFRRMGGAIALGAGYAVVLYEEALHGPGADPGGGADMGPFPGGKPGEEEGFAIDNVTLNRVTVLDSWSGADAGGVYSAAPANINQSVISGNTSNANGGGIYNDAELTISETLIGTNSVLTSPNVGENGGGMFDTGFHTTTINASAINGNEAIGGGGIAARALITVNITNTTISGNTGIDVGGGITTNGVVNLQNVTVANNVATTDAPGGGGGLNSFGDGTYNFNNTLLANNTVAGRDVPLANCGCSGGSATCPPGRMVSQGYNLEDGDLCSLDQTGDKPNTVPLILALADNGGLTETHELTFVASGDPGNSPALDKGDDSNCPNNDQRGSIRPFDGDEDGTANCDIGAFELANFTTDLQISNMVAPDEVFKGDEFTVDVTVLNNTATPDDNVTLVTDALPAQVAFVSAPGCTELAGVVTCNIGALADNAPATVTLTLSAAAVGDALITATVSGDNADANPANNTHAVTVGVIGVADLELTAGANTSRVVVGNEVTVTFTVANLGADDATNVRLGGVVPPEASLVSATPDNGTTCTQSGADVLCELGNLAVAGPAINVVAVFRADQVGTVADVSASVDATERDPDASNNSVTASVTIVAASSGGDSGWCSYNPNARFDPVLPGLVLAALAYLGWRLRKTGAR
jgi:CSLREA domain-containing protein/uncharacterized repeat protein (TIGR01451 family)